MIPFNLSQAPVLTPEFESGTVWATIIAATVTALAAVIVARFNTRQARAAMERTEKIENTKVDAVAFESARETWESRIQTLREEVSDLRVARDADRASSQRVLDEHLGRIVTLEADRERDRARIKRLTFDLHKLSEWARALLHDLQTRGIAYTQPPIDLGDTDPDGLPRI